MPAKPDFSRKFSEPLGPFRTLADVRNFILQAAENGYEIGPWEHIGEMCVKAAEGGDMKDVEIPLRMLLSIAGLHAK